MAKKKSGRLFLESSEERIISDEFDRAVKFVRRQAIKGDAAKYYKYTAKRRKKSVENDSSDDNGNCSYMVCSYVACLRPLLRYRV